MTERLRARGFHPAVVLVVIILLLLAYLALAPLERTLGTSLRLILLHGAWVWTGLLAFALAALVGLAALLGRKPGLHAWSLALGRTGLCFWLTYLPMSLAVMQISWGGFFFDEPRWRIPFAFAVVGVLLQSGLALINIPAAASVANLAFGVALWSILLPAQNVLHPDSPVLGSDSLRIQLYFGGVLVLTVLAGWQVARLWRRAGKP
ncbi:MAG: hypothetical protein GYA17_22715 [Chloroflexi bacterium]|nr:hypothetical protein [Anaerolineaceae bacterium]NMB91184.1 hypothetical protein [Chloroflexota bacterium]